MAIAFLPRSECLNFMAAVTICIDFGTQENKVCHCFHCFPICLPWRWDQMPWSSFFECWVLSQVFTVFHTHQEALSAIRMVSSAYMRLLIFLPAVMIPACASSSPAFCTMYSAYKLSNQGDNTQPWRTPFLVLNQSVFPCLALITAASWPARRFLRRQVRWSGIPTSLGIFQFVMIHSQALA